MGVGLGGTGLGLGGGGLGLWVQYRGYLGYLGFSWGEFFLNGGCGVCSFVVVGIFGWG
jgi:hypothetical protein